MTAVPLPESQVIPLLNGKLSLASVNADEQCVISGPDHAIGDLEKSLADKGMEYHRLRVSHAFHSSMMDPILHEFAEFVRKFNLAPPRIPYISSSTGNWISDAEATDADYWARQLRQSVRFADGIAVALKTADAILLEIGPGNTLSALCEQSSEFSASHEVISSSADTERRYRVTRNSLHARSGKFGRLEKRLTGKATMLTNSAGGCRCRPTRSNANVSGSNPDGRSNRLLPRQPSRRTKSARSDFSLRHGSAPIWFRKSADRMLDRGSSSRTRRVSAPK